MNSAFLGIIAAVCWGVHDFLAGTTSRGIGQLRTTVAVTLFGLAAITLWLVWRQSFPAIEFPSAPIALASGAGIALATLWLFAAFTSGPMALALPIVMSYPATTLLIAALWGAPPTALHLLLAGVVMAGALIAAFGGDNTEKAGGSRRRCIVFALLAHAGFAIATTLGQHAATLIGAVDATWLSRVGGTLLILPVFLLTPGQRTIPPKWLPLLMLMGTLDVGAVLIVNHAGTLPNPQLAIVAASCATIVTVLLARLFLSEAITVLRWSGILMAVAGVALLAVTR